MSSKVAVVRTSPETVLADTRRVMQLAGLTEALDHSATTILKNNISWHLLYPGANTTPWQLEGAIHALRDAGLTNMVCVENETVVTSAAKGEMLNKQRPVLEHHGVPIRYNFRQADMKWIRYEPKAEMLVLKDIFPRGIEIPDYFIGKNVVHLPTTKCHIYTNITGSMKNAFGGLLHRKRHWTHGVIHETLVDLLQIQQDIHPGLFAVMDGTFAGDGPGPRDMRWHEKDILLASADQVAIDAISAKLQGFDPMSIKFIRLAHEKGLGVGDPSQIKVVGHDISQEPAWGFVQEDTFASKGQKMIYHGWLHPLEGLMLRTPLVPWSYFASNFYHNVYWYPFVGRKRVQAALDTKWGRMFLDYGADAGLQGAVMPGMEPKTVAAAAAGMTAALGLAGGLALALRGRKK